MMSYAFYSGADGAIGISFNFIGKECAMVYDQFIKGDYKQSEKNQIWVAHCMDIVKKTGNLFGGCFYLWEKLRGFDHGTPRFPLNVVQGEGKAI